MRFVLGLILGVALTVVAAFVMDQREKSVEKRVVNWDVVGEKAGTVTEDAQQIWDDFTRVSTAA